MPASSAPSIELSPLATRISLAKLTIKMEFDTAMPTATIDPISDTTLIVVPVSTSIHNIPIKAPGSASMMMNGSSHDWNSTTMSIYTNAIARIRPSPKVLKEEFMTSLCPLRVIFMPGGSLPRASIFFCMAVAAEPRSWPSTLALRFMVRCTV